MKITVKNNTTICFTSLLQKKVGLPNRPQAILNFTSWREIMHLLPEVQAQKYFQGPKKKRPEDVKIAPIFPAPRLNDNDFLDYLLQQEAKIIPIIAHLKNITLENMGPLQSLKDFFSLGFIAQDLGPISLTLLRQLPCRYILMPSNYYATLQDVKANKSTMQDISLLLAQQGMSLIFPDVASIEIATQLAKHPNFYVSLPEA